MIFVNILCFSSFITVKNKNFNFLQLKSVLHFRFLLMSPRNLGQICLNFHLPSLNPETVHFLSYKMPELGASLFEIAQSLFALERTMFLGAMALNEKKSEERWAKWQNQIFSGSLLSDIRRRERWNSESDFKDWTLKMLEKRIKRHDLYIF